MWLKQDSEWLKGEHVSRKHGVQEVRGNKSVEMIACHSPAVNAVVNVSIHTVCSASYSCCGSTECVVAVIYIRHLLSEDTLASFPFLSHAFHNLDEVQHTTQLTVSHKLHLFWTQALFFLIFFPPCWSKPSLLQYSITVFALSKCALSCTVQWCRANGLNHK